MKKKGGGNERKISRQMGKCSKVMWGGPQENFDKRWATGQLDDRGNKSGEV